MRTSFYPTSRAVLLMAAGAPVALAIGVMLPRLWTIGFAWMFFVALLLLLDAVLAPSLGSARPALSVSPSAPIGGTVELAVEASAGSAQAALETDPRLAPDTRGGSHLVAGKARFRFSAVRRGTAHVSTSWLRLKGPLGLLWKQRRDTQDIAILVLPDIRPVREQSQLLIRQAQAGETARREMGSGTEFRSLVPFVEGMDRRAIDWKQSARHHLLLCRDWQIERNNQIVLAIDAGRAMSEPLVGVPRIDRAVTAALLTAYVALKLDDRVGLYAYAEKPLAVSAISAGVSAFPALQRLAAGVDYGTRETNHTFGLTRLAQRLDRRTLVILFTEFTDPTSAELMIKACAPLLQRHLLLLLIQRDEELEGLAAAEPVEPEDVTRAVAAQALLRERAIVAGRLRRMGVHVAETRYDQANSALVDAYLSFKRQGLI